MMFILYMTPYLFVQMIVLTSMAPIFNNWAIHRYINFLTGCDSIVNTTLIVNPSFQAVDTVNICAGDSIQQEIIIIRALDYILIH